MYLLLLVIGFTIVYRLAYFLFPYFFTNKTVPISRKSTFSIILIILMSILFFSISLSIPDLWWSNRVLHALGGGFLSFFLCYRVARDTKLEITKFQFFIFSFLLVTALGVGNELVEFFAQRSFGFLFSADAYDTWLDLTCNTVGCLLGATCFVPLLKKRIPNQSR